MKYTIGDIVHISKMRRIDVNNKVVSEFTGFAKVIAMDPPTSRYLLAINFGTHIEHMECYEHTINAYMKYADNQDEVIPASNLLKGA